MIMSELPEDPTHVRLVNRVLSVLEYLVYGVVALLLAAAALDLLYVAGHDLLRTVGDTDTAGTVHVLDTLLLVFIFVELPYAVRETLREQQVLVEPFLLVGILAAI